jgi:hypothetical protein
MSDTPETDHVENNLGNCAHPVLSSFCRKLERERDRLADQIEANHKGTLMLERMVYQLREQRDRLTEAIYKTIMENLHLTDGDDCTLKRLKDVIQFELPNE